MSKPRPEFQLTFEPMHQVVGFSGDPTILKVAKQAAIPVEASCGGMGTCGTCLVKVLKGLEKFEPRNEIEQEMADDRAYPADERLACQNACRHGMVLQFRFPG